MERSAAKALYRERPKNSSWWASPARSTDRAVCAFTASERSPWAQAPKKSSRRSKSRRFRAACQDCGWGAKPFRIFSKRKGSNLSERQRLERFVLMDKESKEPHQERRVLRVSP